MIAHSLSLGRFHQNNLLMVGAWWGEKKPDFHCLFPAVAARINALSQGFHVLTPEGPLFVTLRMLTMTADNPAKDYLVNKKSTACGICQQLRKNRDFFFFFFFIFFFFFFFFFFFCFL